MATMRDHHAHHQNVSLTEYPEELLNVFKAAALSVTKLYKTSTAAQAKARADGYQDCLEDLLMLLDKGGVSDVRVIRKWIAERLDGQNSLVPTVESEDEGDKTDPTPTPEPQRASGRVNTGGAGGDTAMRTDNDSASPVISRASTSSTASSAAAAATTTATTTTATMATTATTTAALPLAAGRTLSPTRAEKAASRTRGSTTAAVHDAEYIEPVEVPVPMQGAFTFRAPMAYPPESYLQLANLDLSDRMSTSSGISMASNEPSSAEPHASSSMGSSNNGNHCAASSSASSSHSTKTAHRFRHPSTSRYGSRAIAGARFRGNGSAANSSAGSTGQKRKLNVEEIFDLASLGYGKDVFGRGSSSKRTRQA